MPGENKENEIVSIPGLRGRNQGNNFEKSIKNYSCKVVEIIEHVYLEIKNYGHEEQKRNLLQELF